MSSKLAATNVARFTTIHRVGFDVDGASLYQVEPHSLEPCGECYRDADGFVVVPAGEQIDVRIDEPTVDKLRSEAAQAGDLAMVAACDAAVECDACGLVAVIAALQRAAAMG